MATVLGPGEKSLSEDELLDKLKSSVDVLTNQYIQADVDREKVVQYANARRNQLYWEGKQFLYPTVINGQIVDFSSVSGSILSTSGGGADVTRSYDYVINHFRGDGRKFIAVLGQRAPNVKARPDRPSDDRAIQLARRADDIAGLLRSHWDVEYVQRHLALSLWKNGTTFLYTAYSANGDRYGWTEEPQLELDSQSIGSATQKCMACGQESEVEDEAPGAGADDDGAGGGEGPGEGAGQGGPNAGPVCPFCGGPVVKSEAPTAEVPKQTGSQKYPNGSVELHMTSVLEVTVPFYVKSLDQAPWLWYEYEEHKSNLVRAYPKLAKKLQTDMGSDRQLTATNMGKITRDIASGPNSLLFARGNRWLYQRFWMRPSMFAMLDANKDANGELKKLLDENYPNGLKATYVAGELVQLENESLDDVWTAIKPETSEYIYANPICEDYLGPQDVINDSSNIMIEWMERAIPLTVVDPTVFDLEALRKYAATPMEFVPAKPQAGGAIKDAMQVMPVAKPEPMMTKFAMDIREEARQIVGILPPIFGGDVGTQTAREAELKRNQAMMQLGTTWNEMRKGWAVAFEHGVSQFAKHAGDRINLLMGAGRKPTTVEITDLAELADGGWHFEAEESMPMTWGQRRDVMWDMVSKGPAVWGLFGLQHPSNLPVFGDVLGMPDYHIPGLNMRDGIMDKIQQLLKEQPVIQPDPMSGAITALPSQPIDVSGITEDHHMVVQLVSEWAVGEDGRRERTQNEEGYQNVLAWARAHLEQLGPPPGALPAPPPHQPAPPPPMGPPSQQPAKAPIAQPAPRGTQPPLPPPPTPSALAAPAAASPNPGQLPR